VVDEFRSFRGELDLGAEHAGGVGEQVAGRNSVVVQSRSAQDRVRPYVRVVEEERDRDRRDDLGDSEGREPMVGG
jgi:hypothetical protein